MSSSRPRRRLMETAKPAPAVHDDRSGAPRVDVPAQTGLTRVRGVGSLAGPSQSLSLPPPMSSSCAGLSPNSVRQSADGATASLVVTFDELPRTILWNDEDRNPRARQPGASYSNDGNAETDTPWSAALERWPAYVGARRRPATVKAYVRDVEGPRTTIGMPGLG